MRRFKTMVHFIVWVIVMVGAVYVCELLMFKYGPTTRHMKKDVDLLWVRLGSLRKELEQELSNLRESVSKEVYDELSHNTLNKLNDTVKKIVADAIELYDSDKTGQTDFAMESLGGSIVSTRNTKTLESRLKYTTVGNNSPCRIIQASVIPGECWTFKGSTGAVVIQLIGKVYITGVSLEHIPSVLSPTEETASAPKDFSVWGLNSADADDEEYYHLGHFSYNNNGSHVQYFEIQGAATHPFQFIELKIITNHGDPKYTCIYRFRVHGKLERYG